MRHFSYVATVLALLAVVVCPSMSFAQTESASIYGRVSDQTGAVVPNADVKVHNIDTNVDFMRTTNQEGFYLLPALKPGRYLIVVSKQGFKTVTLKDVILNVQDNISRNFSLQVGSASESVTVNSEAATINTTDATVSTVVDRQFAENLPMNGRSFQTLIQLTPGVTLTTNSPQDSGQFSVDGQRAASNYWMVDGVGANIGITASAAAGNGFGGTLGSFSALGGTNSLVSVDALQEFRIQTSTYAPEYGRTPGGQISIVTRSGANQFHGSAFDYLRNDVFDANDWFNGYTNNPPLPKAEERQNDFGGTLSGPIVKDRTFFFFSYEGLRLRLPRTAVTTVPCDSSCKVFGDARAMAVPAMQPFLKAFPLPNGPEDMTNPGAAHFNTTYSDPASLDAYSLRGDHKLSDKLTLFGRYNYSPSYLRSRGAGGSSPLSTVYTSRINTQTATVGNTWDVSQATVNEFRFNYSRTGGNSDSYLDTFGGAVPLSTLPFPNPFTSQNAVLRLLIPSLLNNNLLLDGKNARNLLQQLNVVDNLTFVRGGHTLKCGIDFRRLTSERSLFGYVQEGEFIDVPSAETGNLAFSFVQSNNGATLLFRNLGLFAQDTWRVTNRLSLTYGLRWDVDFVPSSLSGPSVPAVTGFNLNDLSQLALAPAGVSPFRTTYGNVAPRFGAAYQLSQRPDWGSVLRGGFGVFFDLASSEVGNVVQISSYPFSASVVTGGGTFPLSPTVAAPPPITPAGLSSGTLGAIDPNLKLPYTLEWSGAFEQGLGRQQTITVSYLGSAGRRLIQSFFVLAPTPNVGSANLVTNTALSSYDALQLQFQRRLSQGLQILASYTWAHSIDTASAGSAFGNSANAGDPALSSDLNRGPSDFDIRNAFSAGITYDIPAPPRMNAVTDTIMRGWSLQNIVLAHSAPPVEVSDQNFAFANVLADLRPDVVPGQPLYQFGPQFPGGKAFNPAAFTDPPIDPVTGIPLRQGNLGRNALRGFGATQWDFAIHRDFLIHDSLKLQFRVEMFNVLNHPNFGSPSGAFPSAGFGVASQMLGQSLSGGNLGGGAFDPLYQIGGPRSIQFALKLVF